MKVRKTLMLCAISVGVLVFLLPVQGVAAQGSLSLTFYGDHTCLACVTKKQVVQDFVALHSEISAKYVDGDYATLLSDVKNYYAPLGLSILSLPVVVLNNSGSLKALESEDINPENLEAWLAGASFGDVTPWGAFLLGLAFGGSPCLLLIMSVLGTTLVAVEERKRYLAISFGLILGLIAAYAAISVIFLAFLSVIGIFTYFKYIFGSILLVIGVWQIVEFKKEKSTIFGTPDRVKSWLNSFIEKQSGAYAFLLGVLFAFVKIPCIGGVYLTILYSAWQTPLLIFYVLLYYGGMILPVVLLLIGLRVGLQSNRVNTFREKYRPHLRLASGIILITLTIYLLLL